MCGSLLTAVSACPDDHTPPDGVGSSIALVWAGEPTQPVPANSTVDGLSVQTSHASGAGVAATVELSVLRGGGTVVQRQLMTDSDGAGPVTWTLGPAPIANELEARVAVPEGDDVRVTLTVAASVSSDVEPTPEGFGDIDGFLTGLSRAGSTEDLAFETVAGKDSLLMGIPGGIARVDPSGNATEVPLSGDSIVQPLGIAVGPDGDWWVCDSGAGALLRVDASGVVATVLSNDGVDDLVTPNHIAFDNAGRLVFTDSCLGRVYLFDPATETIEDMLQLDRVTQGGPNGVAFGPEGDLYLTTENTGLLCQGHSDVQFDAPIGGLFKAGPVSGAQFGELTPVAENVGLFGDGLTFDAEGNLYVIFDTAVEGEFALDESIVFVLRHMETELVRWFGIRDQLVANLMFGRGDFGATTLYLTLLAVPPFASPNARGLVRLEAGVPGVL